MESKLFVFALLFGLAACAESVPDVTGTYRDKGKYIQRDYEITRLEADPKKFKMVITERWRDNELKKNNVYTYTTQINFVRNPRYQVASHTMKKNKQSG